MIKKRKGMNELNDNVQDLILLIMEFKYDEAFTKYYDNNVVIHENEESPIEGLPMYKEIGEKYLAGISNYKAELKNVIISENMSIMACQYSFDHEQMASLNRIQLSLQRWKEGKVIHERHHWN